jgi:hypothetical protein
MRTTPRVLDMPGVCASGAFENFPTCVFVPPSPPLSASSPSLRNLQTKPMRQSTAGRTLEAVLKHPADRDDFSLVLGESRSLQARRVAYEELRMDAVCVIGV